MLKLYGLVLVVGVHSIIFPAACAETKEIKAVTSAPQRGLKLSALSAVKQLKAAGNILTHPDFPDDIVRVVLDMAQERGWKRRTDQVAVGSSAISYDGTLLTTLDVATKILSVISIQENRVIRSVSLPSSSKVSYAHDGSMVAVVNDTNLIHPRIDMYRAHDKGYVLFNSISGSRYYNKIAMSGDGTVLAFTSRGDLYIWDIINNRQLHSIRGIEGNIAISHNGDRVATFRYASHALLVLSKTGTIIKELPNKIRYSRIAISGNGSTLAWYNWNPCATRIWDLTTDQLVTTCCWRGIDTLAGLQLSHDGSLLVVKSLPFNSVELWDAKTGTLKQVIPTSFKCGDLPLLASHSLDILIPNPDSKLSCLWSLGAPSDYELIMVAPRKEAEEADAICNGMGTPLLLEIRDLIAQYLATPKIRALFQRKYGIDLAHFKESVGGASLVPAKK